jgi:predicted outer membrane repeat protein
VLIGHSNTNYANAATDGQGGGIYSFLSDISISSSTCLNNRAKNAHGGGYYGQNSVLGADRCVFQENAANYGGGIYLVNVGAELVETTIFSNRCGVYGGGIRVAGNSNLVLRSIPALNYNTALDGGAIAVDQISGRVTIDAVTCCWNRATRDGGALFVNPGDVHLNACTFNNNQADNDSDGEGNGGGIWVGSNAVVTLTCTGNNMYVNNNQAPDGGGIQVEDTASVILSSPDSPPNYIFLVSNTATNRGGGIHVAGGTLDGTGYINFGNNDAVDGGGLYVSSNCSVRLSGTNSASPYFYLNRAESNGGGICAEGAGATVSLYNVRIGYPNLTNRATHYGGGIAVLDDARLECVNCEIRHNLSINSGGGIYAEDAMVEIRSDNAMATEDMRPLNRFEENEALSHGGGLCNISSKIIMGDVLFSSNSASRGGALYSGSFGTTLVYNALMVFNDASLTGEAVRVYGIGSHAVILQSTIADNGPGHPALAVSTDDALYMTNCIVENHISANQTVNYSDVEDGYPGTGNISDNPMFIDEMTGDYRPAYGSPVINQGIAINGITNDCINAQRPVGLYDMGAYEYNAQTYDSDYDTMIDIWETTFSLDPNNAADALLDTDGDGSTNLYEFIADTSPQNSNDYFRVLNISRAGTTNYVTVPSSTRREYTLYLCPSLDTGAWVQVSGQTNITGTGSPMALEDTGSMTLRHYRAQVIRP